MALTPRRTAALACAATVAALLTAGPAPVAGAATGRTETPLSSRSPITDVLVSKVTIDAPLPASAGAHPAACDTLSYLRFRHRNGPARSADAARVLIAQPGALAGAASMDSVARNTIVDAAAAGKYIEYWSLDRRANCLEDPTGRVAAIASGNPQVALDYYTKGATVNGKKFAGYLPDSQRGWLTRMGMQQTVLDENTVITRELPDPAVRRSKLFCGGHSLGGVVTAFYAMSDFDGNPRTTADAGYNQCAGYFALDTQIATTIAGDLPEPSSVPELAALGKGAVDLGYSLGLLPKSMDIPVVNPETMNLLALAGTYSTLDPKGGSPLAKAFKSNDNVSFALRVLLSKDLGMFLAGEPNAAQARLTNRAATGMLMDDNSMPLGLMQVSTGFPVGGKVVDKNFPLPNDLLTVKELSGVVGVAFGPDKKMIVDDFGPFWARGTGPQYDWLNYDEVGGPKDPKVKSADGTPFTGPAEEVTDIGELSRSMSEYPLDFTEHYFPLAMMTDTALWGGGDRSVVATAIHPEGLTARPTINLLGGAGLVIPQLTRAAGKPLPANSVVLHGYSHLDVLTSAPRQNDGKPEQGALSLSRFVLAN